METLYKNEHRYTCDVIARNLEAVSGSRELTEITAGIEMLDVSQAEENRLRTLVQLEILKNLGYKGSTNRYEAVIEAHLRTFDWAFQDSTEEQHL